MWWFFFIFFIPTPLIMSVHTEANCTRLRDILANSTSDFIACAIRNSRPIKLCENCVQSYLNVINIYDNMTQSTDNETRCIDRFINLDRLQIIETLYIDSYNLWNDAKCYQCFQFDNGTLTSNKSTEAIKFNEYNKEFMQCLNQSDVNETNVCGMCIKAYLQLDNYYQSISNENEKIGVCMDMVDEMNTTRSFWSVRCCKYRKHNEYIFMTSAIAVLIITLCFYAIAQFCSVEKTPTILQQRRFAESFSQPNLLQDQ